MVIALKTTGDNGSLRRVASQTKTKARKFMFLSGKKKEKQK